MKSKKQIILPSILIFFLLFFILGKMVTRADVWDEEVSTGSNDTTTNSDDTNDDEDYSQDIPDPSTNNENIQQLQTNTTEQIKTDSEKIAELEKSDFQKCKAQSDSASDSSDFGRTNQNQANNPDDTYDPNNPNNPDNTNGTITGDLPCSDNTNQLASGYIIANEGYRNSVYLDSKGYKTIGIGHKITGSEPFDCSGSITDAQVRQLYEHDYATHQSVAQEAASHYGVDWDKLSSARQAVATDMAFNMGGNIDGFRNFWSNTRQAQEAEANGQDATSIWQAAGAEIADTESDYGSTNRAKLNQQAYANNDSSVLSKKASTDSHATAICQTTAYLQPTNFFKTLFTSSQNDLKNLWHSLGTIIASATPKAEATATLSFTSLASLDSANLANTLQSLSTGSLTSTFQGLSGQQAGTILSTLSNSAATNVMQTLPGDVLGDVLNKIPSSNLNNLLSSIGSGNANSVLQNIPRTILGDVLDRVPASTLSSVLDGMSSSSITNLLHGISSGDLNSILDNFSSSELGSLMENLSSGGINTLLGSLGSSNATELISQLSGGGLDSVINALGSSGAGDLISSLGGDAIDNILGSGSISSVTNLLTSIGADNVAQVLGEASQSALEAVGNIPGISTALGNVPGLSTAISNITGLSSTLGSVSSLSGVTSALGLSSGSLGVGGLYVPVIEQPGQLLTAAKNTDKSTASIDKTTKTIDETTQDIRNLNIQICTHLRAIRRIQTGLEIANLKDSNALKVRNAELMKYINSVTGSGQSIVQTGYNIVNNGNLISVQVFPKNYSDHLKQVRNEAKNSIVDDIANNSKNLYADQVAQEVDQVDNQNSLASSISQEQIDKMNQAGNNNNTVAVSKSKLFAFLPNFISRPLSRLAFWRSAEAETATTNSSKLTADEYWDIWNSSLEPQNNPRGSVALGLMNAERKINEAEANAEDEYIASQGFLPTGRKCTEKTTDGKTCKHWEVVAGQGAPGSIVKDTVSGALQTKLDLYKNAKNADEVGSGYEPSADESVLTKTSVPTEVNNGVDGGTSSEGVDDGSGAEIQIVEANDMYEDFSNNITTVNNTDEALGEGGSGSTGNTNSGTNTGTNSSNWQSIVSQLNGLFSNSSESDSSSESTSPIEIISQIFSAISAIATNQKPLVYVQTKTPSYTDIQKGEKANKATLIWGSPNATTCKANSNWLSSSDSTTNSIVKEKGDDLGKTGSLIINLPIRVSATIKITHNAVTTNYAGYSSANSNLTSEISSIYLADNLISTGDTASLVVNNKTIATVKTTSKSTNQMLSLLASNISDSTISAGVDDNNLAVAISPLYNITCTGTGGTTDKSIFINR